MKKNIKKIEWIDYVKAFACFLVVLGHILQSFQKAGIDNHISITEYIDWFIYLFHMPLFMCISGFLYCIKDNHFSFKQYKEFEIKKICNLIVPYIVFYLIFIGINMIFASSVNNQRGLDDIVGIINNPMPPYWFLYALMSIFIVTPIIEKICKNNKKIVLTVFVVLKFISIFITTKLYIIDSVLKWGIYFYFGSVFSKKEKEINKINCLTIIIHTIIYNIVALFVYEIEYNCNEFLIEIIRVLLAINGIIIFINIFKMIKKCKILDTFKNYTFQIYLMHTIFGAGIRIVLLKIGITNYIVNLIIGLAISIYVPVLISIISNKIVYTNIVFYPIKTIEQIKERKINYERKKA